MRSKKAPDSDSASEQRAETISNTTINILYNNIQFKRLQLILGGVSEHSNIPLTLKMRIKNSHEEGRRAIVSLTVYCHKEKMSCKNCCMISGMKQSYGLTLRT